MRDDDTLDCSGNDKNLDLHLDSFCYEGIYEATRAGVRAALNERHDLLNAIEVGVVGDTDRERKTLGNNVDEI